MNFQQFFKKNIRAKYMEKKIIAVILMDFV